MPTVPQQNAAPSTTQNPTEDEDGAATETMAGVSIIPEDRAGISEVDPDPTSDDGSQTIS